jgi:GH15 family glucan-1,4-alpha-glucosidase
MYRRSLLTLRALTDSRTGAAAAGARDGWAYVWPRDAATAALAFAAAGYRAEARRVAGFLLGLDLGAAARFHGDGSPVEGRAAQGDAAGWTAVAARRTGLAPRHQWTAGRNRDATLDRTGWRNRADYQEGEPADYLGNAIATSAVGAAAAAGTDVSEETRAYSPRNSDTSAGEASQAVAGREASRAGSVRREPSRAVALRIGRDFRADGGLARRRADSQSGLDSAAAWAVRPFSLPGLYPEVRRTLRRLVAERTGFGITPGESWTGTDPWTAPTAWTAWSLTALAGSDRSKGYFTPARAEPREALRRQALPGQALRRQALRLLGDLRRAATPAGALPERVDARTGVPRSTTPLAWSHAFAILALRELWPGRRGPT